MSQLLPLPLPSRSFNRRRFLSSALFGGMGLNALLLSSANPARADFTPPALVPGDLAVLQFLAAAELIESDLWGQYSELASNNPGFRKALKAIDPSLPDYVNGDFEDETSHANLINAFLGTNAVDLSTYQTLAPAPVQGVDQTKKRLTNLTALTIDTSYYTRYRTNSNPDFGDMPPQEVTITNQSAVPTKNNLSYGKLLTIAETAAFHFGSIEQGGSSLYTAMIQKVTDVNVLAILASIGPTEVYHFSLFQSALENLPGAKNSKSPQFPNIRKDKNRGEIFPAPCRFLAEGLPLSSVIRPSDIPNAGAVATATALVNSGLFTGQPPEFFTAVTNLATAADAATRGF